MEKEIKNKGIDPDCPNCDGTGGALPGGGCGACWNWQGDEHLEHHAKRYPGWGAEEIDGPFTFTEYAEWAASEYEVIDWPYEIYYLETIDGDERVFKIVDPKRTLIISVWFIDGYLHHEEQSWREEYQKYLEAAQ